MKAKAITINVYRDSSGDCTNNGISNRYNELLILCPTGYINVDLDNPPENLVEVRTKTTSVTGKEYKYISPITECDEGFVGWMAGGNIAYSSDSRFRELSDYPLAIHDRQEKYID